MSFHLFTCCIVLKFEGEKSDIWALFWTNSKWGKWSEASSSVFGMVGLNISALCKNLKENIIWFNMIIDCTQKSYVTHMYTNFACNSCKLTLFTLQYYCQKTNPGLKSKHDILTRGKWLIEGPEFHHYFPKVWTRWRGLSFYFHTLSNLLTLTRI